MRQGRCGVAVLFASILLIAGALTLPSVVATRGPREDDLAIHFYANTDTAYTALSAGEIDLMMYGLTSAQAENAFTNPNIVTASVAYASFYELDLNNNYSIPDYPEIRNPMNYTEMRQAVAWLTDKDYIQNEICGGFVERIDQMVAAPYKGWADESRWYPNYPYEYDPLAAKAVLDSRFPQGVTPNPYYDPAFPGSAQYIRRYPADHPQKAGQDLDPLIICVRSDDSRRLQTGRLVYGNMRKLGILVNAIEGPSSDLYSRVVTQFNYHFYTGGWSVGKFPPISLYYMYHSDNAISNGGNYVTGVRPGVPTHPRLDALLYTSYYASSPSEALSACRMAAGYMTDICVNIPLWSPIAYWAWSKDLIGVVNMDGSGPVNDYTFMNAFKTDGTAIRAGTVSAPYAMNIVYSSWMYDYQCLDRMNLYGGMDTAPYDLAYYQAGLVSDWDVATWSDGGQTKTKVTMTYRSDAYFAEPVTGNQKENVDADTYLFNTWLDYQIGDGWWSTSYDDLHHVVKTGPYSFEIYYDTARFYNLELCQGPLKPMDTWLAQGSAFIDQKVESIVRSTPGAISLTRDPIWINYVKFNGYPLTQFTQYNIVLGNLYIYSSLGTGTLEVSYRYVPSDALKGYTPGNLPWQTIFEGAGMYYATAFTPGVGGHLTLKRNPFYWMETPQLGEIDFKRSPPDGEFIVDSDDLAIVSGASPSQGIYVPSDNWFPGADLAPPGGVIDGFDVAVFSSLLGQLAANLAKDLMIMGAEYEWGGAGWNWNQETESWMGGRFLEPQEIKDGYYYYDPVTALIIPGYGLDCSGLVYWAYNKAYGATKFAPIEGGKKTGGKIGFPCNPVAFTSAENQDGYNVEGMGKDTTKAELLPGDLLFFDGPRKGYGVIDHVAMYVGNFYYSGGIIESAYYPPGTYDCVEACDRRPTRYYGVVPRTLERKTFTWEEDGIVKTYTDTGLRNDAYFQRLAKPFGRVIPVILSPEQAAQLRINVKSPVNLGVTDPQGFVVTDTIIEAPDMIYVKYDVDEDGEPDDVVHVLERKVGDYFIEVIPKPGAAPNDTYTLEVFAGNTTTIMAQNVSTSDIPSHPYIVTSSEAGIIPRLDPHDIGITGLDTTKNVIGEGFSLQGSVAIFNYGSFAETFNVTVYAYTSVIAEFMNISLAGRNSTTAIFTWNTAGFAKGNYTISAYVTPVANETVTVDNTLLDDREICVTIPGDVDGDRDVDIFDIVSMAGIYGDTIPPVWPLPPQDIDGDGDVDIFDLVIAAGNYGDSW